MKGEIPITKESINLLVVDDDESFRNVIRRRLDRAGYHVEVCEEGQKALKVLSSHMFHIALVDIKMPRMDGMELLKEIKKARPEIEVIILTGHGTIDSAVEAMQLGAYHYLTKPCKPRELDLILRRAWEKVSLTRQNLSLQEYLRYQNRAEPIIGDSEAIRRVKEKIRQIAKFDSTVLITGETGTGKELVARSIYVQSHRSGQPFIVINSAVLAGPLVESELFGHKKGAFTGAAENKKGLLEIGNGGTIFLDEVGELALEVQAKLLRVMENQTFRSVGGTEDKQTNVRIIAATNRNLLDKIEKGEFRRDLYHRLEVAVIHIPPLRERREDIPALTEHFLKIVEAKTGLKRKTSDEVMQQFMKYHWPGNVRELANLIEQAVLFSDSEELYLKDFPPRLISGWSPENSEGGQRVTLEEKERELIINTLKEFNYNKTQTAKALNIDIRTLQRKLKRFQEKNQPH
jgi:DNA-binding NtrC family response regulator